MGSDTETAIFRVVIDRERQHAIWPALRSVPEGWRDTGFTGTLSACHHYVDEVWLGVRQPDLPAAG